MGFHAIHETQPRFRTLKRVSLKTHTPDRQLHISGLRYYNPEIGRWVSRDPIGERGGWNVYGFVRNGPVRSIDNLGLRLVDFYTTDSTGGYDAGQRVLWEQLDDVAIVEVDNLGYLGVFGPVGGSEGVIEVIRTARDGYICQINFFINIQIRRNLTANASIPAGSKVGWVDHTPTMGRGYPIAEPDPSVVPRELIVAHEKGHAAAFFLFTKDAIRMEMLTYIGTVHSTGFLRGRFNQIFNSSEFQSRSASFANGATFLWFFGNSWSDAMTPPPTVGVTPGFPEPDYTFQKY